jgi:hypothetical protein
MKTHYLTTLINDYERCLNGSKNFEIRSNDRDFQTGDEVLLQEYDAELNQFTGATLKCTITYVLYNHDMLNKDWVVFSFNSPHKKDLHFEHI